MAASSANRSGCRRRREKWRWRGGGEGRKEKGGEEVCLFFRTNQVLGTTLLSHQRTTTRIFANLRKEWGMGGGGKRGGEREERRGKTAGGMRESPKFLLGNGSQGSGPTPDSDASQAVGGVRFWFQGIPNKRGERGKRFKKKIWGAHIGRNLRVDHQP